MYQQFHKYKNTLSNTLHEYKGAFKQCEQNYSTAIQSLNIYACVMCAKVHVNF